MQCAKCAAPFPPAQRPRAAIAIEVMGDTITYAYWRCDACRHYTVEATLDRFIGDEEVSFLPPLPQDAGDRCVELVRACPTPGDKWCECPSHKALYYGVA